MTALTPLTTHLSQALVSLSIPSPSTGVWYVGPFPLRGYALSIIVGIIVAIAISERRWVARGGRYGDIQDLAIWGVPFGLVGGRLYHVITDHGLYFGEGRSAWNALYVWRGGLGIWGAVALGAVGVIIGARRKGIRLLPVLDAIAPAVLVAQAIGRWGNWFNQELYGRPTDLPWGLEIDARHWPEGLVFPAGTTFHPTFLYEFGWNLAAFAVVIWLDRRFRLGHGRVVAAYVMAYTLGRGWIENLRIDTVEYNNVLGLRLNVWTSIVLFVLAAVAFEVSRRLRPGRETTAYLPGREPAEEDVAITEATTDATPDDTPGATPDGTPDAVPGAAPAEMSTDDAPRNGDVTR